MDFEFTAEQDAFRAVVREFAQQEIAPHATEWDQRGEFPTPMVAKLGMHDAVIPTEPKHRAAGRDIFKQIARDLGLNMFARLDPEAARLPNLAKLAALLSGE